MRHSLSLFLVVCPVLASAQPLRPVTLDKRLPVQVACANGLTGFELNQVAKNTYELTLSSGQGRVFYRQPLNCHFADDAKSVLFTCVTQGNAPGTLAEIHSNLITSEGIVAQYVPRVQTIKWTEVKIGWTLRTAVAGQLQQQELSIPQTNFPVSSYCYTKE